MRRRRHDNRAITGRPRPRLRRSAPPRLGGATGFALLLAFAAAAFGGATAAGQGAAQNLVQDEAPADARGAATPEPAATDAAVRVVHGSADAGPIDLYFDDALAVSGVVFPSASDPLFLGEGDHELRIVAAGADPEQPIVETTLTLEAGSAYQVAALGPLAALQANVYEVDLEPPAADRARLRFVHGSPDAGPVALTVADGEALFPPVDFPNETEYADVEAGTYDLEVRGEDGSVALALPGTELEAGVVYDVFAVGGVADGTLAALTATATPAALRVAGRPAAIFTGRCEVNGLDASVAPLTNLAAPAGESLGAEAATATESSITAIPLTLDELLAREHAVVVLASEEERQRVVACGAIGGAPTEEGALIVGLPETNGSGLAGVATLAPGALDPTATDVSVAIAADLVDTAGAVAETDDGGTPRPAPNRGGDAEATPEA